jgi:hypothetical protein
MRRVPLVCVGQVRAAVARFGTRGCLTPVAVLELPQWTWACLSQEMKLPQEMQCHRPQDSGARSEHGLWERELETGGGAEETRELAEGARKEEQGVQEWGERGEEVLCRKGEGGRIPCGVVQASSRTSREQDVARVGRGANEIERGAGEVRDGYAAVQREGSCARMEEDGMQVLRDEEGVVEEGEEMGQRASGEETRQVVVGEEGSTEEEAREALLSMPAKARASSGVLTRCCLVY